MVVVRSFHKYRGISSLAIRDLIAIVAEQLSIIAPEQTKYKVTGTPSERTIRFYIARGLVDKPLGKDGRAAHYGYRHILQLLAIKYLQSQYLPLVKIGSLIGGASNRDLEQIIPEIPGVVHMGIRADRKVIEKEIVLTPAAASAVPTAEQDSSAFGASDRWHRIEVSPGVELHVHEAALPAEARQRLRALLLREMSKLRGWINDD